MVALHDNSMSEDPNLSSPTRPLIPTQAPYSNDAIYPSLVNPELPPVTAPQFFPDRQDQQQQPDNNPVAAATAEATSTV